MANKTTVRCSADIAFIKYWGNKEAKLRLPENGSISMKVSGLDTTTTVEFDPSLKLDQVKIDYQSDSLEVSRVIKHLGRIREVSNQKSLREWLRTTHSPAPQVYQVQDQALRL